MSLPGSLREALEAELGPIRSAARVGGGSISETVRLSLPDRALFVKYESHPPAGFFAAEAAGLEALRAIPGGPRIPDVAGIGETAEGWGWLALEWLEPAPRSPDGEHALGAAVARLHRAEAEGWGWERDGFIGRLPQSNAADASSWAGFWRDRRLLPQLDRAGGPEGLGGAAWNALLDRLPALLEAAEADGPSAIHGDLWSGNVLHTPAGPALVDPSFHRGHREVDLAMAALFGGFGRPFLEGYEEVFPLRAGHEVRRGVYQLYYLLVHVNLFGASYIPGTVATLRRTLAAA